MTAAAASDRVSEADLSGHISDGAKTGSDKKDDAKSEGTSSASLAREDFAVQAMTSVVVTDDVKSALDQLKPTIALYVGGMGHKSKNFHKEMMIRRGFGDAAERIQELYLAKRKPEAIEAVPDDFVDQGALVGDVQRIRNRYRDWEASGATSLTISGNAEAIQVMAGVAELPRQAV